MCWSYNRQFGTRFLAAMPTNLYGPGDNFDLKASHVLPALIRKVIEARRTGQREIVIWGTGRPRREFLYSDDLAQGCLHLLRLPEEKYSALLNSRDAPLVNIGTGQDLTIKELAELVARVLGYDCELIFDTTKQDGTPQKLLDVSRIHALGWRAEVSLDEGIRRTYESARTQLEE